MCDSSEMPRAVRMIYGAYSSTTLPAECSVRLELAGGRCWTVGCGRRIHVSCLRGCVWATEEGDRRDILLTIGRSWTSTGRGKVALQGLPIAVAEVTLPARGRWAWLKRWMEKMKAAGRSES